VRPPVQHTLSYRSVRSRYVKSIKSPIAHSQEHNNNLGMNKKKKKKEKKKEKERRRRRNHNKGAF
jgi:hypothetical protein